MLWNLLLKDIVDSSRKILKPGMNMIICLKIYNIVLRILDVRNQQTNKSDQLRLADSKILFVQHETGIAR